MKHIGGKGPKLFPENKGSCLQLADWRESKIGVGTAGPKRKEGNKHQGSNNSACHHHDLGHRSSPLQTLRALVTLCMSF